MDELHWSSELEDPIIAGIQFLTIMLGFPSQDHVWLVDKTLPENISSDDLTWAFSMISCMLLFKVAEARGVSEREFQTSNIGLDILKELALEYKNSPGLKRGKNQQ